MKRLFWLFLCMFLLTGCSHTYLERQVYPLVVSVDQVEEGYLVGVMVPSGAADGNEYASLSASGETLRKAFDVLEASTPYPMHFSQVRQCIIGYELAVTSELRPMLQLLMRLPSMRPNAQVMVAQGQALTVLEQQKPDFGQRLSTHLTLLFDRLQHEGTLPDSSLSYCLRELGDNRSDLLLGLCAVNDRLVPDAPAFSPILPESEIAGLESRSGPGPVEYLGSVTVSQGRVSGMLSAQETQLCVRVLNLADIRTARTGDQIQLQIHLPKNSTLLGQENQIIHLVEKLQLLHCDALRFGCRASMGFLRESDWAAFDFRQKYPTAPLAIEKSE